MYVMLVVGADLIELGMGEVETINLILIENQELCLS